MRYAAGCVCSLVGLLAEVRRFAGVFAEVDYVVLGGSHEGIDLILRSMDGEDSLRIGFGCVVGIGGSIRWCFAGRCCWIGRNRVGNER